MIAAAAAVTVVVVATAADFVSWHQRRDQAEWLPLSPVAHSTSYDWLREGEHSGNGSERCCDAIQLMETLSLGRRGNSHLAALQYLELMWLVAAPFRLSSSSSSSPQAP